MITSSSIQYITQVLADPQKITDADKESIKELIETYPYFVPARYMNAANQHKKEPFSSPMMDAMQLYMGNWLMYCQFLQAVVGGGDVSVPQEQNIAATSPVAEEDSIIETPQPQASDGGFVFGIADESGKESAADALFVQKGNYDRSAETDESFILPVYTEDYFLHQGMQVSNDIPTDIPGIEPTPAEEAKGLMIMMSFTEWLNHFKSRKEKEAEEAQGQKAVKTMWQKEKLAAALEEENEEIPEKVFEMAVNSITNEDDLVSESLAEVHLMQGRHDKAIEMYRKLSLRNPQKKAYFARKIEVILKDKQS